MQIEITVTGAGKRKDLASELRKLAQLLETTTHREAHERRHIEWPNIVATVQKSK